jgi:glycosyltransferase 2 family protein
MNVAIKQTDRKLWIGLGISLFFMFLLFRKVDFEKLAEAMRTMDYRYLLPAVLFTFISYFFRAVRWRYLMLPMKTVGMRNLFSATVIGYMANNLLPARLGEFVRAYVLAEKERLGTTQVFATLVLDRLFDGFTVLLILLVTFFSVRLPPGMENEQHGLVAGGYITLVFYVCVIAFIIILKKQTIRTLNFTARLLKPFPAKVSEKVIPILGSFIEGLKLSVRPSDLLALIGSSLIIWAFAVYSLDMVLRAFGVHLPITAAMFIMVFLVFAVMIPASPGYVGTYHAACMYGLMAFSIEKEQALSIALIVHAVNFFPVIALGLLFLWRDNLTLSEVRAKSTQQGSIE